MEFVSRPNATPSVLSRIATQSICFSTSCLFKKSITFFESLCLMPRKIDGLVVRAFASGAVDWSLIPSRVKPVTLKLVFTASLLDAQH